MQSRRHRSGNALGCFLLALSGLTLALAAAPAEAGGSGSRGYRGHGSHGSHGFRGSVGYRGHGRYHGGHSHRGHGSFGFRHHGSRQHGFRHHGFFGGSHGSFRHRGYPSRHYYYSHHHQSYRHYYPYRSYSRGHRSYPQPIYHHSPGTYGGAYVYNGAFLDPGYAPPGARPIEIQQPVPSQPQPIYIVVPPPDGGGGYPGAGQTPAPAYGEPDARQQPVPSPEPYGGSDDRPGQVYLSVTPVNAAVYLDEELLGSGDSLAELSEPLVVSGGVHVLEVLHPDYEPQRLFFGMPAAGRLQIDFDLDGDGRGRKARMKSLDRGVVPRAR